MEKITRLVFICTGNTCRSPMACGIAAREAEKRGIIIDTDSAGIAAAAGQPASDGAIAACRELNIDLTAHRAKRAGRELYSPETLFAVMSPGHADWLHEVCGIPAENITLLGQGIPDPFGQPIEGYREARNVIKEAVCRLLDLIEPLTDHAETDDEPESPEDHLRNSFLVIRTREGDIAEIAGIEKECFSDAWSAESFAEELTNDNADMFTVIVDGMVCGYGLIITAGGISELPKICIAPRFRRLGMAKSLLFRLECAARLRESEELTLEVRLSNTAAQSLYEAMGFERIGIRPNFYHDPTEDAVIMTKKLGPIEELFQ